MAAKFHLPGMVDPCTPDSRINTGFPAGACQDGKPASNMIHSSRGRAARPCLGKPKSPHDSDRMIQFDS